MVSQEKLKAINMATQRRSPVKSKEVEDSRGLTRIYTDVPRHIAQEFAVLAVRRDTSKRALMAELIMKAVAGK